MLTRLHQAPRAAYMKDYLAFQSNGWFTAPPPAVRLHVAVTSVCLLVCHGSISPRLCGRVAAWVKEEEIVAQIIYFFYLRRQTGRSALAE